MIKRGLFLLSIMAGVAVYAVINPVETPKVPHNPRFVKLNAEGKPLKPWAGPWKCVHDTKTGLVWEVKSYAEDIHDKQCSFSWFDGQKGVKGAGDCFIGNGDSDTLQIVTLTNEEKRCGFTGWRLPSEKELRSLLSITPKPDGPHIASDYFPYTARAAFWTSDADKKLTGHFKYKGLGATVVSFRDSRIYDLPYSNTAFVRLVATKR